MKKSKLNNKKIIILGIVLMIVVIGIILLFMNSETNNELKSVPYVEDNINQLSHIKDEKELPPKSYIASVPIFMYHFILDDYRKFPRC